MQVDKADLCKLCVHRLPAASTSSGGSSLDAVAASVKASLAAACKQAGATSEAAAVESAVTEQQGSTGNQLLYVVFKHAGEANEVFAALPGKDGYWTLGRTANNTVITHIHRYSEWDLASQALGKQSPLQALPRSCLLGCAA
jgi:hypothetical protein